MKSSGYGKEYKFAHDFSGAFVEQEFLPRELTGKIYILNRQRGYEKMIRSWTHQLWKSKKYRDQDLSKLLITN
jgi:putative ATPase